MVKLKQGLLIAIEGADGSGKGGLMQRAVDYLKSEVGDENVVQTKEPGGTLTGDLIREILFEKVKTQNLKPNVLDLLFLASHVQNYRQIVEPALDANKIVISDRWWYSQEVYSQFREVHPVVKMAYKTLACKRADVFIFLYGDPRTLYERANGRTAETHQGGKAWNKVETLGNIQERYLRLYGGYPEFFPVSVDDQTQDEVWLFAQHAIIHRLEQIKQ